MTGSAKSNCPTELSTIPPLPFWPSLKWNLLARRGFIAYLA